MNRKTNKNSDFIISFCVCDDVDDCWKQTDLLAQWIWLNIQFSLIVRIQFSNRFSVRHLIYNFVEVSMSLSLLFCELCLRSSSVLFNWAWICAVCIVHCVLCLIYKHCVYEIRMFWHNMRRMYHIISYIYWNTESNEWLMIWFYGVWCWCLFLKKKILLCTFCIKFDSLMYIPFIFPWLP